MGVNVAKSVRAFRLSPEVAKAWRKEVRRWRDIEMAEAKKLEKGRHEREEEVLRDANQALEIASKLLRGMKTVDAVKWWHGADSWELDRTPEEVLKAIAEAEAALGLEEEMQTDGQDPSEAEVA